MPRQGRSSKPTAQAPRSGKKAAFVLPRLREHHVAHKRAHRADLSTQAEKHWKVHGERAQKAYLRRVRTILQGEGFKATPFQWRHKGHAYGLIKDLGDKQIHVRVYSDGVIDAEIEIHKRFIQHLWSPRPSAHKEVQAIFRRHGIPVHLVNQKYVPKVGATRNRFPKGRTKVTHLVGAAASGIGLAGIYTARILLERLKRGRLPI